MRGYLISEKGGPEVVRRVELPEPTVGPNDVLVNIRACSLNYRDLSMLRGGYTHNNKCPLIPLSDGAGEVVAVGEAVTRFKPGDRVAGIFIQKWLHGDMRADVMDSALGGAMDGMLRETVCLSKDGWVHIPPHLSFEEAACLPCAAVTAWHALTAAHIKPGDTVLALGTGGVSIFALQLAKLAGARVIITTSSEAKADKAKALGADHVIHYKQTPNWSQAVLDYTDGRGVDNVIEVGGPGTLEQSLEACRVSGTVSLIGVLTAGRETPNPSPMQALFKRITIRGIYVGSREMFEAMNQAISQHQLRPVIDSVYSFEEAPAAYAALKAAGHLGKIVIKVAG